MASTGGTSASEAVVITGAVGMGQANGSHGPRAAVGARHGPPGRRADAFVLTSAERARSLPHPAVLVHATATGGRTPGGFFFNSQGALLRRA